MERYELVLIKNCNCGCISSSLVRFWQFVGPPRICNLCFTFFQSLQKNINRVLKNLTVNNYTVLYWISSKSGKGTLTGTLKDSALMVNDSSLSFGALTSASHGHGFSLQCSSNDSILENHSNERNILNQCQTNDRTSWRKTNFDNLESSSISHTIQNSISFPPCFEH